MNDNTPQNTSQETPQKGVGMIKDDNIGIYDNDVAMMLDLNCAAIYSKLKGWVLHNQNNGRNLRDGRYWTYNSMRAWSLELPFLSESQIRYALDKLENAGLIVTGSYNQQPYDRTKWYSVNPVPRTNEPVKAESSIPENPQSHLINLSNENDKISGPIPILNTSINQIKPPLLEEHEKISENQNEIGKVFKAYEGEIGILTPMVSANIQEALEVDNIPPDWIVTAIGEASRNNKRNWAYVSAILKNWKANGFQTDKGKPQGKAKGGFKKPKYDMGDYEVSHKSEIHIVEDKDWEGFDGEVPF